MLLKAPGQGRCFLLAREQCVLMYDHQLAPFLFLFLIGVAINPRAGSLVTEMPSMDES